MIRSLIAAALLGAVASLASAQGQIDTVARGAYACELPGDADVGPGRPLVERNFVVETGSRYSTAHGGGAYLRRGDVVEMTSGPRKGEKYQVMRPGFLRLLGSDGRPGRLRCVHQGHVPNS
ncbi:MAG TPA: elongation factor P [Croceibacterium sp.]|jgi:hypothetical protein